MGKRHPNYRHVKIHRNYTVEDIANLFVVHKNTVRNWLKNGLATTDAIRPKLIHGQTLSAFLKAKRMKNKQKCKPGEMYCLKCRAPKMPDGEVEYQPKTATLGNLVGICPDCYTIMNRRVSLAKLDQVRGQMDITMPQALRHIYESDDPTVNINFKQESETC